MLSNYRKALFLGALCVLSGFRLSAQTFDRHAFTITQYDLNLRVEPNQQRLAVRGKIKLRNDGALAQKKLSLQISSSLNWRSISIDHKAAYFDTHLYTSDIDHTGVLSEAVIALPAEVPPHTSIELEIGYEGVLPLDATRLTRIGVPAETALHTDWDQIGKSFAAVRGMGHVIWYPISTEAANLSEANSMPEVTSEWQQRSAQSQMHIHLCVLDEGQTLSSLMNDPPSHPREKSEQDGQNCSDHTFAPLARTIPTFVIGNYEHIKHPALDVAYLPGHKAVAENYTAAAEQVLPFITKWFGAPQQPARVVELSDAAAAPFESGPVLLTPLNEIHSKLAQVVAVHQLTHAAFPSSRLWIYEGLAHFAQPLYREQQTDRAAALSFMKDYLAAVIDTEKTAAADTQTSAGQSLINTGMEELYRSKSMYVWWMLRDMVGDSALKDALAAYRPDQDQEPSYVQHLLEEKSKHDLEWFFDDWVYRDRGLPDFRVQSVYPRQTMQNTYMVTIVVENLGASGAEVPVTVTSTAGDITKRIEVRGKSKNSIRIVVSSFPTQVSLNDGSVPETDMSNNVFNVQGPAAQP